MTDRPILFSGPMVRAILDGRKTQTRRPLQPKSGIVAAHGVYRHGATWMATEYDRRWPLTLPVAIGDRLWVRESWYGEAGDIPPSYAATDARTEAGWRPSIHMPRWASRLTLIVTDVRVQRLREISEEDAIAEGVRVLALQSPDDPTAWWEVEPGRCQARSPISSYASLWDACYGSGAWEANPWVVATTFTVHHLNIDKMREE